MDRFDSGDLDFLNEVKVDLGRAKRNSVKVAKVCTLGMVLRNSVKVAKVCTLGMVLCTRKQESGWNAVVSWLKLKTPSVSLQRSSVEPSWLRVRAYSLSRYLPKYWCVLWHAECRKSPLRLLRPTPPKARKPFEISSRTG